MHYVRKSISKLMATVFFIGYCPIGAGTVASLIALPFYILLQRNIFIYIPLVLLLLVVGFWASEQAKGYFSGSDPHEIVIDEFSSMLLAYLFIPFSLRLMTAGFLFFRFFDILKIPPIKKLQKLSGGVGIMLDDIASAILTNLVLQILVFAFHPYFV